jgi:Protein of unknown function (DUF2867)
MDADRDAHEGIVEPVLADTVRARTLCRRSCRSSIATLCRQRSMTPMRQKRDGVMRGIHPTASPRGLAGALYWYLLYPLHAVIFSDLARAIARDAVKREHDA